MSTLSLDQRLRELERRLLAERVIGPTAEMPFGIFVYPPGDELELRHQVRLSVTRLENAGKVVRVIKLGDVMWECLNNHPLGPDALAEAERSADSLEPVLAEAHELLIGSSLHGPGQLESKIIDELRAVDPATGVAYLIHAAELFPIYRTSALLERFLGHVTVPSILFYPGVLYGTRELKFMDVCDPSPNYRPTIYS